MSEILLSGTVIVQPRARTCVCPTPQQRRVTISAKAAASGQQIKWSSEEEQLRAKWLQLEKQVVDLKQALVLVASRPRCIKGKRAPLSKRVVAINRRRKIQQTTQRLGRAPLITDSPKESTTKDEG